MCVPCVTPPLPFSLWAPTSTIDGVMLGGGERGVNLSVDGAALGRLRGFWGKVFRLLFPPPPTSLGVWCYCREPLRKSQQEVLFLDYLCISVRYPWQQLFSLDFITPLFLFLLLPRAVFCNLL